MLSRSRLLTLLATLAVPAMACAAPQAQDGGESATGADELQSLPSQPADSAELPSGYDAFSALEKQSMLGQVVSRGRYCAAGEDHASCLEKLPKGGFSYYVRAIPALLDLHPTFYLSSDEAPEGRRKIFHPFGVAGEAEYVPDYSENHHAPYSGLLSNGAPVPLMLRMAPGGGPSFIPGASVKFLIDGKPSRNFVAIHDFNGLPKNDWNYFKQDIGHIYPDVPFVVKAYFQLFTPDPSHLPITHLGEIEPNGADVPKAAQSTPYEIVLRGNAAVVHRFPNADQHDFRFDLEQIEPGTTVYDVMARPTKNDATFERIGTIRTKTALVATSGGDKQLFFKHPGAK